MNKQPSILITGAQGNGKTLLTTLIADGYNKDHVLRTTLPVFNQIHWTVEEYVKYELIIIEEIKGWSDLAAAHAKCISLFSARPVRLVFTCQQDLNPESLADFLIVRACYTEYIPQPVML